jgi:cytochrome c-type biogenesis protein CcmI
MFILIAALVSCAAVAFVAWPLFFDRENGPVHSKAGDAQQERLYQKRLIEEVIQDLDFDLQTGKLSLQDHEMLVAAQNRLLTNLDDPGPRRAKQKKTNTAPPGTCRCGAVASPQARFCSQCGAALR